MVQVKDLTELKVEVLWQEVNGEDGETLHSESQLSCGLIPFSTEVRMQGNSAKKVSPE